MCIAQLSWKPRDVSQLKVFPETCMESWWVIANLVSDFWLIDLRKLWLRIKASKKSRNTSFQGRCVFQYPASCDCSRPAGLGPQTFLIYPVGWYWMIWRIYSNPSDWQFLWAQNPTNTMEKPWNKLADFPLQHPASHRSLHQGRPCCEILQATNCVWSVTWIWQRLRRRAMQGAGFPVAVDPSSQFTVPEYPIIIHDRVMKCLQ